MSKYSSSNCEALEFLFNSIISSSSKFDSGCGWPAFSSALDASIKRQIIKEGHQTEITCTNCGGHLGLRSC